MFVKTMEMFSVVGLAFGGMAFAAGEHRLGLGLAGIGAGSLAVLAVLAVVGEAAMRLEARSAK